MLEAPSSPAPVASNPEEVAPPLALAAGSPALAAPAAVPAAQASPAPAGTSGGQRATGARRVLMGEPGGEPPPSNAIRLGETRSGDGTFPIWSETTDLAMMHDALPYMREYGEEALVSYHQCPRVRAGPTQWDRLRQVGFWLSPSGKGTPRCWSSGRMASVPSPSSRSCG